MSIGVMWFRQDLRLSDNPALTAACRRCEQVLCLFIDDPEDQTVTQVGSASRVWLHHSLAALQVSLRDKGSELYYARGSSEEVLEEVMGQIDAARVFWNRCYDPVTIDRDRRIKLALAQYQPGTFNALLLQEPWDNLKGDGTAYRVFTPYWRSAVAEFDKDPQILNTLNTPRVIPPLSRSAGKRLTACVALDDPCLLPEFDWHVSMMTHWRSGEVEARAQVERFLKSRVNDYGRGRDLPGQKGTSHLSPHLHFGEISPRHVMNRLLGTRRFDQLSDDELIFAKEIVWREFAYSLLYHFPHTIDKPLDTRFRKFRWARDTDAHLSAWQRGQTGVPIVDAGMRELYATGWMHNRVRMIVASYLIKNLLIPWQKGERWFRDTLVDADLASNSMGWQWTAGSGADASPFFRIFNPVLQGEKFDRQGDYVRRWVPELAGIADRYVHKPWELDSEARNALDYPCPLVDLKETRLRALEAFSEIKGTNRG